MHIKKADLLQVKRMFDGTLGVYPHNKVHIDIDPNAKPMHSRPYPVPQIHLKIFMKCNHLVRIGVSASQQESEWASPSFITPKKDGRVRWISNLLQLNKVIKHKQYPFQIITDILRKRSGSFFLRNLTLVCITIRLSLTSKVKTSLPSFCHLVITRGH